MRIVRTRSIPNVDDDRLMVDLARLHEMIHVNIREWDDTRRSLVDHGIKTQKVAAELMRRGHPTPECPWCRPVSSTAT